MTVAEVARRLGVGAHRVRQLDGALCPSRCQCGTRHYSPEAVAAYEQKRAADRAGLARSRAERINEIRNRTQPRRRKAPGDP